MPASRSRTQEWRRSLRQIAERGGAIEITIARPEESRQSDPTAHATGPDLVWRVKILELSDEYIAVESPMALGRGIGVDTGADLVGAITIGQNRWTFRTTNLGPQEGGSFGHPGLRLAMPKRVDRSQRRRIRVDTQQINLPKVEMWPLLDPKSVMPAERANELAFAAMQSGEQPPEVSDDESVMPTVGPKFEAKLANLGGGGVGLSVEQSDAGALGRHRLFWLRLDLAPELPVPACATGKVVHTHMDSSQCTYVGIAFDFTFNPSHQAVLAAQIAHYIEERQELQRQAKEQRDLGHPD